MVFKFRINRFSLSFLAAIALVGNPLLDYRTSAQVQPIQIAQLSSSQKASLEQGKAVITGQNGQYVAQIVIKGSIDKTWQVLTDYNNFETFLPNLASSDLLESNGNQKVFEQVNVIRVLMVNKQARTRIATTENYPRSIAFNLVEGDLDYLDGVWRIEPFGANKVLITQTVAVQPESNIPKDFFYNLYKDSLQKTLEAIKKEAEKRSNS